MHFTTVIAAGLLHTSVLHVALVYGTPIVARQDGACAGYTGPDSVAGRKSTLQSQGATVQDLAIAVLENAPNLNADYTYGDGKTGDSANFGLFKNNWYAIRTYCSQFQGQSESDYNNGAALNSDDAAAIACQHQQIQALGDQSFYNLQRNGNTGTYAGDYADAINHNVGELNSGHLSDNYLPCYQLHPI